MIAIHVPLIFTCITVNVVLRKQVSFLSNEKTEVVNNATGVVICSSSTLLCLNEVDNVL